jgi:hypothetical protein
MTCATAFAQGFERHLQTNPVPILETIGDRFRDTVDSHRLPFDSMCFDFFGQGRAAIGQRATEAISVPVVERGRQGQSTPATGAAYRFAEKLQRA